MPGSILHTVTDKDNTEGKDEGFRMLLQVKSEENNLLFQNFRALGEEKRKAEGAEKTPAQYGKSGFRNLIHQINTERQKVAENARLD